MILDVHGHVSAPDGLYAYKANLLSRRGAHGRGGSYHGRLRTLWYDTCLYTRDAIELLIRTVGADRCLFGSEKPGTGSVRNPASGRWFDDIRLLIEEIDWLTDEGRARVFAGNAAELFGLAQEDRDGGTTMA
jgi:hypothetical protein